MASNRIVKFDPWLLGAIQKAMGNLPALPGDLVKIKSLTIFDGGRFPGDEGLLLNGWLELTSGDFSAIGKMSNLHTLSFKNHQALKIGNFDFLCQCRKLKKLDLSGTDFSDCELLAELPNLQYALLPDRRQLIHTQVLERIQAQTETEPEQDERSRANVCIGPEAPGNVSNAVPGIPQQTHADTYTADPRLIYWLAVSLGKMPKTPGDLAKVRLLDSLKRLPSLDLSGEKLPPWLVAKEGDFSLIGKLPHLQALLLWDIVLDDFSFLAECKNLIYVNLWNTNFTDCRLLANLPFLHKIYLPEMGQLENFLLLKKRREAWQQEEQQKLDAFLNDAASGELPETEQALAEWTLARPRIFLLETQSAWGQRPACASRSVPSVSPETPAPLLKANMTKAPDIRPETDAEEAIYTEDAFKDLITVRGEDVVISYEGKPMVRHVQAEFCMDQTPTLWKVFDRVRDEENNWARLSPQKVRQLTDELLDAIIKDNVATLYISLEPWGEDHIFILEFAGGWVDITYMDDEASVYYNSYNPAYTNPAKLSPVEFEGQTPIPKMLALEDMQLAAEIVRHILATGQLLPGTLWKTRGVP